MTPLQPDAHWLAALQARASQPPRAPRLPLLAGAARVGSVEAGFFEENGLQAAPELREVLQKTERSALLQRGLAAKNMQQLHATDAVVAACEELAP